ncbi:MAG: hypothetical protein ACJA07_000710 [Rhodococcus sp. (in: high G+C Gram-positive bacteria)]|jgi:hypothetical protein
MHLLQRRAGLDDHRRRDDHGSRLPVLLLRERRLAHLERRRRGNRRHRRHRDDRPERRRGDPDGRLWRERDATNAWAWHPGSGEVASSRDSDEVRPGREPDEARPGREPDATHPPVLPDEVHPDREPDDRHPAEEHREPDEARDARWVRTSTGCYRREEPWVPAWARERPAWVRPAQPEPRMLPGTPLRRVLPAQRELAPMVPERPGTGSPVRLRRVQRVPTWSALRAPQVFLQPGLPVSAAVSAWGRAADRRAWRRWSAWARNRWHRYVMRCCRSLRRRTDRCRRRNRVCRMGTTHAVDALRALRRWTMRT